MSCAIAMTLLGLCQFTFAGEPLSPHALGGDRDRPAQVFQDRRAGAPVAHPSDAPVVRADRRGRINVRIRG